MYRRVKKITFLLLVLYPAVMYAQDRRPGGLSIKAPATYRAAGKDKDSISCFATRQMVQGNRGSVVRFTLHAMNDVRNVPMELTLEEKLLPLKASPKEARHCIFTGALADIFSLNAANSRYRWKWHARARVPVSPVADVAGQKVKTVHCWFTMQANKQIYSSDTVSISIQ